MPFWGQNKPPKVKFWGPSEACFDPKKAFYGQTLNFLYYIHKIWQLFGLTKFFFSSAPWGSLFSNRTSFLKILLIKKSKFQKSLLITIKNMAYFSLKNGAFLVKKFFSGGFRSKKLVRLLNKVPQGAFEKKNFFNKKSWQILQI